MATLNAALDVAKTALFAAQKAITVTSHNIANSSTEGYTRQRAVLEASEPLIYGGLMFGTGVNVASVQRVYDSFSTAQYREASSSLSRFEADEGLLKRLEAVFNDINGSGALTYMDKFFNAFQNVANNAPSYTERAQLLSTANSLADTFNNIASELEKNLSGLNDDIVTVAGQINTLSGQVADMNLRIAGFESSGAAANDLRDKRDIILDKMSEYVSINVVESDTGAVDV
ncbi:MAG: flagellar hook-associated protein FlgK, partial [Deltaproteobacteria bacterium]|nr:flagellar hook-associated protein FlgK [Deltaproteobacteria bacterium]